MIAIFYSSAFLLIFAAFLYLWLFHNPFEKKSPSASQSPSKKDANKGFTNQSSDSPEASNSAHQRSSVLCQSSNKQSASLSPGSNIVSSQTYHGNFGSPAPTNSARQHSTSQRSTIDKSHSPSGSRHEIHTKVFGVTYDGRQAIVASLSCGDPVVLRRVPSNPFDKNAIRVEKPSGAQIGFLSKELAASLAPQFDRLGNPINGTVSEKRGGNGYSYGISVRFSILSVNGKVDNHSLGYPRFPSLRSLRESIRRKLASNDVESIVELFKKELSISVHCRTAKAGKCYISIDEKDMTVHLDTIIKHLGFSASTKLSDNNKRVYYQLI